MEVTKGHRESYFRFGMVLGSESYKSWTEVGVEKEDGGSERCKDGITLRNKECIRVKEKRSPENIKDMEFMIED